MIKSTDTRPTKEGQGVEMELNSALVVGPDGFIGQNVVGALKKRDIEYNPVRKNRDISALPNKSVDCVFFCAGNSAEFRTRDDPLHCLRRNVFDLQEYLTGLEYKRFVHFSSTAVYPPELSEKMEQVRLDPRELSLYGAHKLLSERYVQEFAQNWVILRPAYLYGPGLWKNLFYDIRVGKTDIYLTKDSHLAALDVRYLADAAVELATAASNEVFNVASSHVISIPELMRIAPMEFSFHDERHIDQRGISLEKLHQYWQEPLSETGYQNALLDFFQSGNVDTEKGL